MPESATAGKIASAKMTDKFWSSQIRQGHSIHEVSYRACFKPQLPEYFIERFTSPGDLVADPFMGRGTTAIQAHLMGRQSAGSDINPLCVMLARPRFAPPSLEDMEERLRRIAAAGTEDMTGIEETVPTEDLHVFYHPETLKRLFALKYWFLAREESGNLDAVDDWLRMVCLSRLSGHSPGFFSVRTMPPNQSISAESQRRINERTDSVPERKDVAGLVMRKSRSLLRSPMPSSVYPGLPTLRTASASDLGYLESGSVDLIVTSPPFLNIVNYRQDNWLRCWFAGINPADIDIAGHSEVGRWEKFVEDALTEMCRVVKDGGRVAFEVGEVRGGKVHLEEAALEAAKGLPLVLDAVLINQHSFTKTSHIWGVANNKDGTNTNRVVLLRRAG